MKLEVLIQQLKDLNKDFSKGLNLKNYCLKRNLSYTSTSRILNRRLETMHLRTAYRILGLTPDRNISQAVLDLKIQQLLQIKKVFEEGLL